VISLFSCAAPAITATVRFRADGQVALALGADETFPEGARFLHFHPARDEADAAGRLASLRERGLPVHGLSPGWIRRHGLLAVDSLSLFTGSLSGSEPAADGWQECLSLGLPYVATILYGPRDSEAALAERLALLREATSVVLLPREAGDQLLGEECTDGVQDARFLALARRTLPESVRVRASWAALGWKMAQATLAFGADELAGWGLEEALAYGKKGRPAATVGAAEVRAGIEEAGREPVEI